MYPKLLFNTIINIYLINFATYLIGSFKKYYMAYPQDLDLPRYEIMKKTKISESNIFF